MIDTTNTRAGDEAMTLGAAPARKPRGKKAAKNGMTIHRYFTDPDTHPYDEIEWETRSAGITDENGKVIFEQKDVEMPVTWSQLATNVVVSKYFKGPAGTPQRERSLKQLISRVADTMTGWGTSQEYFASDDDASAFNAELTHLLVNQYAAFNSPVWFNVGVEPKPQCSACQPYWAKVATPHGLVPIGDIVTGSLIGLEVFDANGVTQVVNVKQNGVKPVLRLHAKSGHQLDVTPDHLVWKMTGGSGGRFVEAGTLQPGDRLLWVRSPQAGDAFGKDRPLEEMAAEAALAGWLQTDGFVGRYDHGRNRSLTIEAITMNDEEHAYVLGLVETLFPGYHLKVRDVETQDTSKTGRRIRMYGDHLQPFIDRWNLMVRREDMTVPAQLFTAPLPVVAAYLRSAFQAEGYVTTQTDATGGTRVGMAMISEGVVRGCQQLLARLGIFSRVRHTVDARPDRKDTWVLSIGVAGDRALFANLVGFVDDAKSARLAAVNAQDGRGANDVKTLDIARIEELGEMPVYDIQTRSGEYLSDYMRVHNCFIQSVQDDMSSIMDLAKNEVMLFKYGSGTGSNLSRIRGSEEHLAGGGQASGPVSFMKGYDSFAGVIKSGGKTRRAAKMVILNVDHPDIEQFINCKAEEEKKAWALIDAGYDGGFNVPGGAYDSIQFQNANNSIRVTNDFMKAVETDGNWTTHYVTDGQPAKTMPARDLMKQISDAAWVCGDPGMQYDTTINDWHTCPNTAPINASNPCSEYMFLDDSACNLASLNLMKFRDADGEFDVEAFCHAVSIFILAQEIIVDNASYPTPLIARNSYDYRPLGLGYANLGALLMARGVPYDGDAGRAMGGAITALMTGQAYKTSAQIAAHTGPFAGYEKNRNPALRVIRKHGDAVDTIDASLVPEDLLQAAHDVWDDAYALASEHGVRNSQVTVLAPTGTIAFFMDCDTTGVEPDIALVKYKKLVGGGLLKIVNNTVPEALRKLGYTPEQGAAIIEYIDQNDTIEGAPGLLDEHLPVFDCAFKPANGLRSIHYMGHVRMMAAAQPFISGAISKTVNMPTTATSEEIAGTYLEAWRMGLKAIAIYRDGCKRTQPLNTSRDAGASKGGDTLSTLAGVPLMAEARPARRRLADERISVTHKFSVGGHEGYITVGLYEDGDPGEVFITISKEGSVVSGMLDAFATSISLNLQYGVPLEVLVKKFSHMRFEPSGFTNNKAIPLAKSIVDYIFRWLSLKFLPNTDQPSLPLGEDGGAKAPALPATVGSIGSGKGYSNGNGSSNGSGGGTATATLAAPAKAPGTEKELVYQTQTDAPPCSECGTMMVRSGACYRCINCGTTSGCS